MKRLMAPMRELSWRDAVPLLGGLVLLTVYLYQGHHSFYRQHLGGAWAAHPLWDMQAQGYQFLAALVCMALLPALWIRLSGAGRLADYGVALGDWRFGLRFLLLGMVALALPLYINAGAADFQAEYPLARVAGTSLGLFLLWELCYLVYYIAWEFFFRGFWQLGLQARIGFLGAMALQTGVSTVMHGGKPQGEMLAAIVAGPVFGLVAVRTRSVLWVLLLHWYVGGMTDLFCLLRGGGWLP